MVWSELGSDVPTIQNARTSLDSDSSPVRILESQSQYADTMFPQDQVSKSLTELS